MAFWNFYVGDEEQSISLYVSEDKDGANPGEGKTGLVAADFSLNFHRTPRSGNPDAAVTAFTLADLTFLNDPWQDTPNYGVKEKSAASNPGEYRVDLPNAALALEGEVVISGTVSAGKNAIVHGLKLWVGRAALVAAHDIAEIGTVDTSSFTPTTSAFEVTETLATVADQVVPRRGYFTKGTTTVGLRGAAFDISAIDESNQRITVSSPLPTTPAGGDKFVLVG